MVVFKELPPPADLAEHIQSFWVLDAGDNIVTPMSTRVLPGGCTDLIFTLDGSVAVAGDMHFTTDCETAIVLGPTRRGYVAQFTKHTQVFGVRIRPGKASAFLNEPVSQIADSFAHLDEFWGVTARDAISMILEERSAHARAECLANFMRSCLRKRRVNCDATVSAAMQIALDIPTVDEIAGLMEVSVLDLQRKFKQHVGFPPKLLCRIFRFRKAINMLKYAPAPKWADIAYECGFFDQSHFIKDFTEFALISPLDYLSETHLNKALNFYLPNASGLV